MIYLRARCYDSELGRFSTPDPLAFQAVQAAAVSPYAYASNDPLNSTDPLGLFSFGSLFSHVVSAVKHVVSGARHVVHAVTSTVTRGADIIAGSVAHAFEAVHSALDHVAAIAAKDAARVVHVVRDAATHVVSTVRDAVSRSVGVVKSAANSAITWIKKHNQIIGKIGTFLGNVSGDLALAGLVIAPIPGLDFLTPVLEGAAAASAIGALATQGIAKAAGDRNITYGDLLGDALGAIPGGGDVEDAEQGLNTVSRLTDDAAQDANTATALPDDALVVRGGAKITPESIERGTAMHPSGIVGFSTQSAPGASLEDLSQYIRNNQVGVTTVGAIREAGGAVTQTSGWGLHATVSGLDPATAAGLFGESIPNPVPRESRILPW